ncbi:hypothetical protein RclHR1_06840004 [Rhizophagus clarus]|uniref:Ribonuclease H-like domain-containing protein n=1 Tax=Rhizophagus clarus TaxID=94130 RepID=A0A2Z6SA21_9GLOM|nr:hypothetical protein RclHR1_06840004 [Rhizophagus clarus]GET00801.1 ribonuclease H-like domain-containing protein [Rhizophagus clarus]
MRIVTSANNNIVHHKGIIGTTALYQYLKGAQFAEFIIKLNSSDWGGISTRILLRKIQIRLGIIDCIITIHPSAIVDITNIKSFSFKVLREMKSQLYNFSRTQLATSWNIIRNSPTIIEKLKQITSRSNASDDAINKDLISYYKRSSFQYQHWLKTSQYTLEKCVSCINSKEQQSCIKRSTYNTTAVILVKMVKLSSTENGFRIITPTDLIQYKKGQSHNYLSEQEHLVLEIKIDKLEIEIIRNRISSTILQDELIQHHDNMTKLHTNELHIYTDRSLNPNLVNGYNQIIMGAGWIVKNTKIDFICGITYFSSSTRPELLAILTALLTVPIYNNTHIYTDSQSAIDSINNMLQLRGIIERKLFKQNNYILLYAINDKADKLAKKGSELALENEDRIVDLELILNNSNFEFIPKWSGVCIDRQIRKFCAQISDAIYEANWSCNKYWSDIFID